MNIFIEVLGNSGKLRYQAECINNNWCLIILSKKLILSYVTQATSRNELLGKGLGRLSVENQS
jgi:hypothetical protein